MTAGYTIYEHDGMFDVLVDGLTFSYDHKSREEAEAVIADAKKHDAISELADINIESAITNLTRRFELSRDDAKRALRSALLTL